MLPAGVVGVGGEAREPLCLEEDVGVVVGEALIAATAAEHVVVDDVEGPGNLELLRTARGEARGHVDAHHRVVDDVAQRAACAVGDRGDLETVRLVGVGLELAERGIGQQIAARRAGSRGCGQACDRVLLELVLVELEPGVGQRVGRVVPVGDGFAGGDALGGLVERCGDDVVGLLLPVGFAWRAGGGAVGVGGWQVHLELAELVLILALCLPVCISMGRHAGQNRQRGGKPGQFHAAGSPKVIGSRFSDCR